MWGVQNGKHCFLVLEKAHLRIYGTRKPVENLCLLHRNGACALAPVQDTRSRAGGPFIFAKHVRVSSRMRWGAEMLEPISSPHHHHTPPTHTAPSVFPQRRAWARHSPAMSCLCAHKTQTGAPLAPIEARMALRLFCSQLFAHLCTHPAMAPRALAAPLLLAACESDRGCLA